MIVFPPRPSAEKFLSTDIFEFAVKSPRIFTLLNFELSGFAAVKEPPSEKITVPCVAEKLASPIHKILPTVNSVLLFAVMYAPFFIIIVPAVEVLLMFG